MSDSSILSRSNWVATYRHDMTQDKELSQEQQDKLAEAADEMAEEKRRRERRERRAGTKYGSRLNDDEGDE